MANPSLNRPLANFKARPSQYSENGHGTALRNKSAFAFDADIIALGAAASALVRFTTGDKAIVLDGGEFTFNQEDALAEVYEGTTFSAAGTPNATYAIPMNRLSSRETELTFYDSAVVDTIGTRILHQELIGAAGQNVTKPGFGAAGLEAIIVLKPNTEHIFKLTNNSVLAINIEAHFDFHEVDAKEYS